MFDRSASRATSMIASRVRWNRMKSVLWKRVEGAITGHACYLVLFALAGLSISADTDAQVSKLIGVVRASQDLAQEVANGGGSVVGCCGNKFSKDGRWMVFESDQENLIANDSNGHKDVFLRDRQTGATSLVSKSTDGVQGDADSFSPSISEDGRRIVFTSWATTFIAVGGEPVPEDEHFPDVFVHDVTSGETRRVTVNTQGEPSNGWSEFGSISGDGNSVVFRSIATNLITDPDVWDGQYVHHLDTGITELASDLGDIEGQSVMEAASISSNGRYVAFTAVGPVPGASFAQVDVFVRDLVGQTVKRITAGLDGDISDGDSSAPMISSDGRYVLFNSMATNLIEGDNNGQDDLFIADLSTDSIRRLSLTSTGEETGHSTRYAAISGDASTVAFLSSYPLTGEGEEWKWQLFRVGVDGTGLERWTDPIHDTESIYVAPVLSFDAKRVGLRLYDEALTDEMNYVFDAATNEREAVAGAYQGLGFDRPGNGPTEHWQCCQRTLSRDGRFFAFQSSANNLVVDDGNQADDVFVYDADTGDVQRVSLANDGLEASRGGFHPAISGDARYVAFASKSTNLDPADTSPNADIFIHDRLSGQTQLVSTTSDGVVSERQSDFPALSDDGRYVSFASNAANLIAGGPDDGSYSLYRKDRQSGAIHRVNVGVTGQLMGLADLRSELSANGRRIAFVATDTDPDSVYAYSGNQLFVRDLATGNSTLASVGFAGEVPNGDVSAFSLSGDGQRVAFVSAASNLVLDEVDGEGFPEKGRVYVRDLDTGETRRMNLPEELDYFPEITGAVTLSADGSTLAIELPYSGSDAGGQMTWARIAVVDLHSGDVVMATRDAAGAEGNGESYAPTLSGDGQWIGFVSDASNWSLNEGAQGGYRDAFLARLSTPDFSGSFYNPDQSGHGWLFEQLHVNGQTWVTATWYAYDHGKQLWMAGLAQADADQVSVPMTLFSGGEFPPDHDPSQVEQLSFGQLDIDLRDDTRMHVQWHADAPGFASGEMSAVRLTRPSATAERDQFSGCFSGSWYDPEQSGHGLQLEVVDAPDGTRGMFAIWYHYLAGEPRWLLGNTAANGASATMPMFITEGAEFPPDFSAADVQQTPWGTMNFTLVDVNTMDVTWETEQAGYSPGTLHLVRLTSLDGHACQAPTAEAAAVDSMGDTH